MKYFMHLNTGSIDTEENWAADFNENGPEWYAEYISTSELPLNYDCWLKHQWEQLEEVKI